MSLIPPFIFACTVNIDAFLVGLSYGFRSLRITIYQNLLISLISLAGTMLSILSGSAVLLFLPPHSACLLGSGLLAGFGCFYLGKYLLCQLHILLPAAADAPRLPLSLRTTLLLGLSLSCNNIGIGVSASLGGISLAATAFITFVTSVLFLSAGNALGHSSLLPLSESTADLLSGIMLILLGLYNAIF